MALFFNKRVLILALTWSLSLAGHAAQVPFILPWNDGSPGPVDLSYLNPAIGTNSRVVVNAEGHFEVNGKRLRFVGMNFAADSPFMPLDKANAVAARISKFGINCVRFHHMDSSWALNGGLINYGAGNSRTLKASQLEKVHNVVSRLNAHGVYSDINLMVGRTFNRADGLPMEIESMDFKDQHVVAYYDDNALALHKEYATQLLTPINKYTGVPLAADPGVVFVEIMNENGLAQKWLDGGLDRLPAVFYRTLQGRWNSWLADRYTNDANMNTAWQIIDQPLGSNLLKNGAFSNGLASWTTEKHDVANALFSVVNDYNGKPSAKIQVTTPGSAGWYIQLNQPGLSVTNGQAYTFSWWAKANQSLNIDVSIMQAHGNYSGLGYAATVGLTTNWQKFSATFQANATDVNGRPNFGGFATQLATVWLADVRVQPGGQIGVLPAGTNLAQLNVPNIPHSANFAATLPMQKDWMRFLVSLENRYYGIMRDHLRNVCHYPGLIFGTIIANSPPNVQAALDVVDGHAYWQHPSFPRIPWDAVDWYTPNTSMVNDIDNQNTLAGLARQRVKGKPFTVTEYQHPSPNYYGAEGPLLMAAYGALQDWDGFWFFDYGLGCDATGMGYFHSFFDTAQHPTKMANLLLASLIFRRGDVSPALKEYTLPMTPETELNTLVNSGNAWNIANGAHLGMPGKLALVSRLYLSVGTNATGLSAAPAAPSGNNLISDNNQLRWNASQVGKGVVTINSPRTKAIIGFTDNQSMDLGGVKIQPGTTQLGWSTIAVCFTNDNAFAEGGSALAVASGQVDNTGMTWKDTNRTSVGNVWGRSPTLVEVIPWTLVLPVSPERVKVSLLDARGQRGDSWPVGSTNGMARIQFTTNTATIWYEILIAPDTGFQKWRFSQFSPNELANTNISIAESIPFSDGIANLIKYGFGLDPTQPTDRLADLTAQLKATNNHQYLSLTFPQVDTASDLVILPEVSSDLEQWNSGPQFIITNSVTHINDRSIISVRDTYSTAEASQRFMRLLFQLNQH